MKNAIMLLQREIVKCEERIKEYSQIADNPEMQTSLILAEESTAQVEALKKEYVCAAQLLLKSINKTKSGLKRNVKKSKSQ